MVYLICGVPGAGKTWIAKQLEDKFNFIPHDSHQVNEYYKAIVMAAKDSSKPILAEAPFRISVLEEQIRKAGIPVKTYYINEPLHAIAGRYQVRENKAYPKMHQTNYHKYSHRPWNFSGTSDEVLEALRKV